MSFKTSAGQIFADMDPFLSSTELNKYLESVELLENIQACDVLLKSDSDFPFVSSSSEVYQNDRELAELPDLNLNLNVDGRVVFETSTPIHFLHDDHSRRRQTFNDDDDDDDDDDDQNPSFSSSSSSTELGSQQLKFNFNDYVCINGKKCGLVKYVGRVHFAQGLFCGIELDEKQGKHDGKIDNIRYFKCKQNYGIFAPIEKIKQASTKTQISIPDQAELKAIDQQSRRKSYVLTTGLINTNSLSCVDQDINNIERLYLLNVRDVQYPYESDICFQDSNFYHAKRRKLSEILGIDNNNYNNNNSDNADETKPIYDNTKREFTLGEPNNRLFFLNNNNCANLNRSNSHSPSSDSKFSLTWSKSEFTNTTIDIDNCENMITNRYIMPKNSYGTPGVKASSGIPTVQTSYSSNSNSLNHHQPATINQQSSTNNINNNTSTPNNNINNNSANTNGQSQLPQQQNRSLLNKLSFQFKLARFQSQSQSLPSQPQTQTQTQAQAQAQTVPSSQATAPNASSQLLNLKQIHQTQLNTQLQPQLQQPQSHNDININKRDSVLNNNNNNSNNANVNVNVDSNSLNGTTSLTEQAKQRSKLKPPTSLGRYNSVSTVGNSQHQPVLTNDLTTSHQQDTIANNNSNNKIETVEVSSLIRKHSTTSRVLPSFTPTPANANNINGSVISTDANVKSSSGVKSANSTTITTSTPTLESSLSTARSSLIVPVGSTTAASTVLLSGNRKHDDLSAMSTAATTAVNHGKLTNPNTGQIRKLTGQSTIPTPTTTQTTQTTTTANASSNNSNKQVGGSGAKSSAIPSFTNRTSLPSSFHSASSTNNPAPATNSYFKLIRIPANSELATCAPSTVLSIPSHSTYSKNTDTNSGKHERPQSMVSTSLTLSTQSTGVKAMPGGNPSQVSMKTALNPALKLSSLPPVISSSLSSSSSSTSSASSFGTSTQPAIKMTTSLTHDDLLAGKPPQFTKHTTSSTGKKLSLQNKQQPQQQQPLNQTQNKSLDSDHAKQPDDAALESSSLHRKLPNKKMNETFDLDEETTSEQTGKDENLLQRDQTPFSLDLYAADTRPATISDVASSTGKVASKKRESMLIFETTKSDEAEFLENEMLPDDLLDEINFAMSEHGSSPLSLSHSHKSQNFLTNATHEPNPAAAESFRSSSTTTTPDGLVKEELKLNLAKLIIPSCINQTSPQPPSIRRNRSPSLPSSILIGSAESTRKNSTNIIIIPNVTSTSNPNPKTCDEKSANLNICIKNEVKTILEDLIDKLCPGQIMASDTSPLVLDRNKTYICEKSDSPTDQFSKNTNENHSHTNAIKINEPAKQQQQQQQTDEHVSLENLNCKIEDCIEAFRTVEKTTTNDEELMNKTFDKDDDYVELIDNNEQKHDQHNKNSNNNEIIVMSVVERIEKMNTNQQTASSVKKSTLTDKSKQQQQQQQSSSIQAAGAGTNSTTSIPKSSVASPKKVTNTATKTASSSSVVKKSSVVSSLANTDSKAAKVAKSTAASSGAQKSLLKKLNTLPAPSNSITTEQVNKLEEDFNSVFESDNQTSCSSDNEVSLKSSSREISLKSTGTKKLSTKEPTQLGVVNQTTQSLPHQQQPHTQTHPQPHLQQQISTTSSTGSAAPSTAKKSATSQQRRLALSASKQNKGNNKENLASIPKNIALNKIYKSRDGLAAVSSNTSIMSEVSNISKSSLPSSIPASNSVRHASISSISSATKQHTNNSHLIKPNNYLNVQQHKLSTPSTSSTVGNSNTNLAAGTDSARPAVAKTATTAAKSQHPLSQSRTNTLTVMHVATPSSADYQARKFSTQSEAAKMSFKKPGPVNVGPSINEAKLSAGSMLHINTAQSMSGASSSHTAKGSPASSSSTSVKSKSEVKLNREIKRLEGLCESRTKELSILKLKLKDTLCGFEAIAVAYNYLANQLNGFEANGLKARLEIERRKKNEEIKRLEKVIDDKETNLTQVTKDLEKLSKESAEMRTNLETKLAEQEKEHIIQLDLLNKEHDLVVKDIERNKETLTNRLNKQLETLKAESEKQIAELQEELEKKLNENTELESRLKECEEALAKDKDERIQRLLDTQHNLEKEIESLKAALDIKNKDLVKLRTQNNELITKVENFDDLSKKLRKYKHEIEQLNEIIVNKQETERRTSEHNRLLSMKIEAKIRENDRLSKQNEELKYRLSHSDLNITNNSTMTSGGTSVLHTPHRQQDDLASRTLLTRGDSIFNDSSFEHSAPNVHSLGQSSFSSMEPDKTPSPVKLRSKSLKTTNCCTFNGSKNQNDTNNLYSTSSYMSSSSTSNNCTPNQHFRPVSENFDFNINERDLYHTRSVIMYHHDDAHPHHHHHHQNLNNLNVNINPFDQDYHHRHEHDDRRSTTNQQCNGADHTRDASTSHSSGQAEIDTAGGESSSMSALETLNSTCSSNSHLENQNSCSPMSSESCMNVKSLMDDQTLNQHDHDDDHDEHNHQLNPISPLENSTISLNEQSVLIE